MLTVCKHLLFDTYDRVYLKEFGMEQVNLNTQLAVKILFDDYYVFL